MPAVRSNSVHVLQGSSSLMSVERRRDSTGMVVRAPGSPRVLACGDHLLTMCACGHRRRPADDEARVQDEMGCARPGRRGVERAEQHQRRLFPLRRTGWWTVDRGGGEAGKREIVETDDTQVARHRQAKLARPAARRRRRRRSSPARPLAAARRSRPAGRRFRHRQRWPVSAELIVAELDAGRGQPPVPTHAAAITRLRVRRLGRGGATG